MKYYEAIGNAILKIQENVLQPVKLECDIKTKSVKVFVKIEGSWELAGDIIDFDNVSHLEIENFILGSIENADSNEE